MRGRELRAGSELAHDPKTERERVHALLGALHVVHTDDRFFDRYGAILAEPERRGERISTMDLLIATVPRVHDVPLPTRNTRDFERVPRLDVRGY